MIIKCPECGHQVSDKAPVCPSCGVEIAGHIVHCSHCGEIYLKEEGVCPNCHQANPSNGNSETSANIPLEDASEETRQEQEVKVAPTVQEPEPIATVEATPLYDDGEEPIAVAPIAEAKPAQKNDKKGHNTTAIIVSLVVACLVCAVCLYFYHDANINREAEEYNAAMISKDPTILQQYINSFPDADATHLNNVKQRLLKLQNTDEEWTNAMVSNSKEKLLAYIDAHPASPHKQQALDKIDEIDWQQAKQANTEDSYSMYISEHRSGLHVKEATDIVKGMLQKAEEATKVSDQEKASATSLLRRFFQAVNSKSSSSAKQLLASNATVDGMSNMDEYINSLFQADVKNLNWHLGDVTGITKSAPEGEQPEYKVNLTARKSIQRNDANVDLNYNITAMIKDGKIESIRTSRK